MKRRFVILLHQTADSLPGGDSRCETHSGTHWDIMLEDETALMTWSIPPQNRNGKSFEAEAKALPAHRKHYLDYEGEISGNRGMVQRIDAGFYETLAPNQFALHGTLFNGTLLMDANKCQWQAAVNTGSMENDWIEYLHTLPCTRLIGDDAAVIGDRLITVDMLTEGVDFILAETDPQRIGRKALAVNLSDIAAMGGIPVWVFVAVALPKDARFNVPDNNNENEKNNNKAFSLSAELLKGMMPLIDRYHLELAGGDTNSWDGGLVISITVVGKVSPHGIFRRTGSQIGDKILTTGTLGGSILGHQFLFEPRLDEALYLNEHHRIHSAMDISDGLTLDLHRLLTADKAQTLGAILYEERIPVGADAEKLSALSGCPALEHALSDGEDFELLLTVDPDEAERLIREQPLLPRFGTTLYEIGEITRQSGLRLRSPDGKLNAIEPKGFLH
ncbi:hypothetical protein FACS189454_07020 [Planctomycetales bacterium]|nr:hypothetical protein FACS189454_07020 [Planctomycetales bacterium]